MPRPRLPRTLWEADSIRVEVKSAGLADEPENAKIFSACLMELNEVRLRLMISCYGPGTEDKPKSRYYFLLGESATVHCRDLDVSEWFREQLLTWLKSLDGIRLEKVEDGEDSSLADGVGGQR
jgi:hypothetical protein